MKIWWKVDANLMQVWCRLDADLMQIWCRFDADLMQIWCRFDAHLVQIWCRFDADFKSASNLRTICIMVMHIWCRFETCIKSASNLRQICIKSASNLHQICIKFHEFSLQKYLKTWFHEFSLQNYLKCIQDMWRWCTWKSQVQVRNQFHVSKVKAQHVVFSNVQTLHVQKDLQAPQVQVLTYKIQDH